ncbi:MAG: hypothetical protein A2W52_00900 [Candidatus Taylorbacteria bacterium RIFCSPHIGHO2_02_49_25]|uniref:Maf-like protein n=1 Tax=Candidatus Taylorbacteria bacterium RIFCSPHIGHO2_02_49_25 TaxID=1802305 RepID=A0A1G2MD49_9BACT|nr:MAG: hypothetical protein A2759_00175 [Candidatus Taylorbacteria bacterium RIFCSPHIGHO2_01_FULL_49_60]OHA20941.1 MAG: hypothetical protein A2W52_00900 [Candidatus Taylorbacteria bacterium RIFCSPHIGHO2_02_49_25]OHA36086.1 MAG: hypothetical protein A3B27_03350 [Candidatus Taylorbacteria bacterium RIFCSPLOWO2_01_FULL_50_130]OHA37240.1 MAG: hypothetical protein A2W65_03145 [Candidatus Taylorbacteria bacterium RIFCSPLOWO2_02_50_13]OHA41253.1 MAG: hypothetical protein A3H73_01675 [Candidatus Taylo
MKNGKTITICSSASFYRQVLEAEEKLRSAGFNVLIPDTARRMQQSGNFEVSAYKTWYSNDSHWGKKTELMKNHFAKVMEGDAMLVLNFEKNCVVGYIGGNVLMEMVLAFHYQKPIYVLYPVDATLPLYEEVLGMRPIFLNGILEKIWR